MVLSSPQRFVQSSQVAQATKAHQYRPTLPIIPLCIFSTKEGVSSSPVLQLIAAPHQARRILFQKVSKTSSAKV